MLVKYTMVRRTTKPVWETITLKMRKLKSPSHPTKGVVNWSPICAPKNKEMMR